MGILGTVIWSVSWTYFLLPFPPKGDAITEIVPKLLRWQEGVLIGLSVLGPIIVCLAAILPFRSRGRRAAILPFRSRSRR